MSLGRASRLYLSSSLMQKGIVCGPDAASFGDPLYQQSAAIYIY